MVAFVGDLEDISKRLKQTEESYELAHNKLAKGRGNLVRQAENLKQLGVKPARALPTDLVEQATDSAEPAVALLDDKGVGEGAEWPGAEARRSKMPVPELPFNRTEAIAIRLNRWNSVAVAPLQPWPLQAPGSG